MIDGLAGRSWAPVEQREMKKQCRVQDHQIFARSCWTHSYVDRWTDKVA